ncbi:unnamed protein product [Musa acuminata var. zebrina]
MMFGFMAPLSVLVLVFFSARGCLAASFTFVNNCQYTVWPGVLSNAGNAALSTTGFAVEAGQSRSIEAPAAWSGRFWGRTLCATDSTGKFSCGTGDCGSGKVECSGRGAAPPATLAEFTLGGGGNGTDYYDVSLVDGYNLAMLVAPQGGSGGGGCVSTGCVADLNGVCPSDLRVVLRSGTGASESVACKSACDAFGSAQYCCSGAYSNPNTCKPSSYSQFFKNACPKAYSYAFDDATSTFTCSSADYLITFCPGTASTSHKSTDDNPDATGGLPRNEGLPSNDGGAMVILGGYEFGQASPRAAREAALATVSLAALTSLLVADLLSLPSISCR